LGCGLTLGARVKSDDVPVSRTRHIMFAVNLGGEGEEPGVLNQQPPGALDSKWLSVTRKTVPQLVADGHQFLICPNDALALPDECADRVYTNSVPIDTTNAWFGPGAIVGDSAYPETRW
jgi:hypothetical protein